MPSRSDASLAFGVIGSGFAARTLVAAATASPLVAEVVVAGGSRTQDLCDRYAARACASVSELLSSVGAVAVATPHATHAAYVAQALEAGVHVLCEKPFVTLAADGERLIEKASRRGLTLSVNHFQRYRSPHRAVSDFLATENVRIEGGQARLVEIPGVEPWKTEPQNRGFTLGYGIHVIDLLHAWTEATCLEVAARSLWVGDVERCTTAMLRFSDGQEISLFASDLTAGGTSAQPGRAQLAFELLTSSGVLSVDSYGATVLSTAQGAQELGRLGSWDHFDSPVRLAAYRQALDQFLVACLSGEEPELTAAAALRAVRVCDAIENSARRGGELTCV